MNISYLIIPDHVRDGSLQVVVICVLLIMSKKRKSSTMVLHLKYFQAAEIDLKGSKDSSQRKSPSTYTISSSAGLREVY